MVSGKKKPRMTFRILEQSQVQFERQISAKKIFVKQSDKNYAYSTKIVKNGSHITNR